MNFILWYCGVAYVVMTGIVLLKLENFKQLYKELSYAGSTPLQGTILVILSIIVFSPLSLPWYVWICLTEQ